jgi:hypothetical protein
MKETETEAVMRPSRFVGMARVSMTISIITSMLVILFYSLLSPLLPARTDSSWPIAVVCSGYVLLTAVAKTEAKVRELDFGDKFDRAGNHAFQSGRLRLSVNGAWLFCTVNGGIRCVATGLN